MRKQQNYHETKDLIVSGATARNYNSGQYSQNPPKARSKLDSSRVEFL